MEISSGEVDRDPPFDMMSSSGSDGAGRVLTSRNSPKSLTVIKASGSSFVLPSPSGGMLQKVQVFNNMAAEKSAHAADPGLHQVLDVHRFDLANEQELLSDEYVGMPAADIRKQPLLVLAFQDLTYTVRNNKSTKACVRFAEKLQIHHRIQKIPASVDPTPAFVDSTTARVNLLDGISGEARDGEILAVMGASGSGKSTLIDALAQRISPTSLGGNITLNGEQVSNRLLRSISAYVMQDDLLFPMLTVKETLLFSAEVRLPRSHSKAKKGDRVNQLLHQLGLHRVANTIIGDEGHRGVSGGERRRVSIGIDIIHDPLLLFLDEPTSGLDSTSAYKVIKTLQKIAHTGSIVILSIHQPSYRILGLLDRLILLAFGQKIYGGSPAGLNAFFEAFGRPVPEHENSTEHALDLIADLHLQSTGIKPLVEFSKIWMDGIVNGVVGLKPLVGGIDVRGAIQASIARGKLVATRGYTGHEIEGGDTSEMVVTFATPWWCEVPALIWRSLINIQRTPELFAMRMITVVITAFLLASVFWRLDHSPKGVQDRLGLFAFAMSTTYYTCADAMPVFLQERYIFLRETAHNAYRKSSYVIALSVIFIPFLALLSIAFAVVIWWAVGLAGGGPGFFFFFLIVWASFWAGNSFVILLSAVMPNVMLGYTVVVAMLAYFLLLSGFFIPRDRIPKYWIWFHYTSIIRYPYEAVLINEFDRPGICYERASQILFGTPLAEMSNPALVRSMLHVLSSALPGTPYEHLSAASCVLTGHDILESHEITQLSKWACLGVTVGFGVLFRVLFYIFIRFNGQNKRH